MTIYFSDFKRSLVDKLQKVREGGRGCCERACKQAAANICPWVGCTTTLDWYDRKSLTVV